MRKLLPLLAFAATAFSSHLFGAAPAIPRKAPEFVIQMPDGAPKQLLSSYKGKAIVLALMLTTCPHCQHTAGILAKIQTEYAPKGGQVLGVTFDQGAPFRVADFNKKFGVNFPCGFSDIDAVRKFLDVDTPIFAPALVFIDKQGMIRGQYVGDEDFLANQEVNIRAELDKMLKPAAATTATRKAPK